MLDSNDEIKYHELMAHYWMTMAVTGVGKNRNMSTGFNGPQLTDEEKVADCMENVKRHIDLLREFIDVKRDAYIDRPGG